MGAEGARGQGWFRPHEGAHPPLHCPVSGGPLRAGQTPSFRPGEWTAGRGPLDTGWAGSCVCWLCTAGGPGAVPGCALLRTVTLGFKAGGSRLSSRLPAHLQTSPTSPSEVPRAPPGSSASALSPAFHLIASLPTSDSAVSLLCSHRSLPFQSPQLTPAGLRGSRFNTQTQSPPSLPKGPTRQDTGGRPRLQWGPWALPF